MDLRGSGVLQRSLLRPLLFVAVLGVAGAGFASTASATTFTNSSPITITDLPNGMPDNGSPYPSSIAVSGLGTVTDVNVTVLAFNHTHPDDVGLVLVAPGGQALELMNAVGDDTNAINVDFTFDDSAAGQLPPIGALSTGTYKPTSYDHLLYPPPGPGLTYSSPGPDGGGTATLASTFNGSAANGTWNLFVRDFYDMDSGSIRYGWALDLSATPIVGPARKKCKKHKKRAAAAKKKCKRKKGRK
jgi:subtilisin-like proprotein convertase family protein